MIAFQNVTNSLRYQKRVYDAKHISLCDEYVLIHLYVSQSQ